MTTIEFLQPMLALIVWTAVIWLWMYATRIPAMQKAGIDPEAARHPGTYGDLLPASTRSVADNHNHLHEQPTLFYALMLFIAVTGGMDQTALMLGWAYVISRIVHSLVQIVIGKVMLRFAVFCLSSIILFVLLGKEVARVFL